MDTGDFFETTFEPDFNETIAMARAAARYRFSRRQRFMATMAVLACAILIWSAWAAALFCLFLLFIWLHAFAGFWAFIMILPALFIVTRYTMPAFGYCSKIDSRMSARWITGQKPLLPVTVTVNSEKIRWASDESGVWLNWPAVERLFVTSNAIGFLSGAVAYYIPRRSFTDDAATASFVHMVIEYLPVPARSLSLDNPDTAALLAKAPPNRTQD